MLHIDVSGRYLCADNKSIGMTHDANSEQVRFTMPRWYGEVDLSGCAVYLVLQLPSGLCDKVAVSTAVTDTRLDFSWTVAAQYLALPGKLLLYIACESVGQEIVWQSKPIELTVTDNGYSFDLQAPQLYPAFFSQWQQRMEEAMQQAAASAGSAGSAAALAATLADSAAAAATASANAANAAATAAGTRLDGKFAVDFAPALIREYKGEYIAIPDSSDNPAAYYAVDGKTVQNPSSLSDIKSVGDEGAIRLFNSGANLFGKELFFDACTAWAQSKGKELPTRVTVEGRDCMRCATEVFSIPDSSVVPATGGHTWVSFFAGLFPALKQYRVALSLKFVSASPWGCTALFVYTSGTRKSMRWDSTVDSGFVSKSVNSLPNETIRDFTIADYGDRTYLYIDLDSFQMTPLAYAGVMLPATGRSMTIPLTEPLRSLPDGTADSIRNTVLTRKIGKRILTGNESIATVIGGTAITCTLSPAGVKAVAADSVGVICSRLSGSSYTALQAADANGIAVTSDGKICVKLQKSTLTAAGFTADEAGVKAWLQSTATVVYYPLATETAEQVAPVLLRTFSPLTCITTTNATKPVLTVGSNTSMGTLLSGVEARLSALEAK